MQKTKYFSQASLAFCLVLVFSLFVGVVSVQATGGMSAADGGTDGGANDGVGADCGNPDGADLAPDGGGGTPNSTNCSPSCSSWTPWSACSTNCGTGTQTRTRQCTDQKFNYELMMCVQDGSRYTENDSRSCTDNSGCPPPTCSASCTSWSAWSSWSSDCGSSSRTRTRTCTRTDCSTWIDSDSQQRYVDCTVCTPSCGTWIVTSPWSPSCGSVSRSTARTCVNADCSTYSETGTQTGYIDCSVPSCTPTNWTPDPSGTCNTDTVTQTSNCGTYRTVSGTMDCSTPPPPPPCIPNTWTPNPNTVCNGENFSQTSNCPGVTRNATGSLTCPADDCQNGSGDQLYEYCVGDDIWGRYRQINWSCVTVMGGCISNNSTCDNGLIQECESGYTCREVDAYNAECVPKSSNWMEI